MIQPIGSVRDVNLALKKDPAFYPSDERAGFNFGKAIVALVETLRLGKEGEIKVIEGIIKPLERKVGR